MGEREHITERIWQMRPNMNTIQDRVRDQRIQQQLGEVVRGVLPGAGPRHEYHPNPYLEHLYRGQDDADGATPSGESERVSSLEDLETQLQEVLTQTHTHDVDERAGVNHSHRQMGQVSINGQDWKVILSSVSFGVILFLRLMVDHILEHCDTFMKGHCDTFMKSITDMTFDDVWHKSARGLLVFVALHAVFYYANLKMIEIVYITSLRDHQNRMKTLLRGLWLIGFLSVNILCIYWFFEDQHIWRVLYFQLPSDWQGSLFTLFWVTMVTDYILRFGTIALKALLSMMPSFCLPQKKKGKYYMFVETVSQMYRSVVPVVPWIHFLYDQPKSGKLIFAAILVFVYVALKLWRLFLDNVKLLKAIKALRSDTKFGVSPTDEEIKSRGENCPICQDDYQEPVMLACKHIFCENCVSVWFDREKTCPMCRAEIQSDNPEWQDGSTSAHLQWY